MRYHNITKDDMNNGDGLRVVLWVAGCRHCCKECQNPITWDPDGGLLFDDEAKKELFDNLEKPYISGITFSGGDPLHIANELDVRELINEIKEKYPNKKLFLWTGYTIEEVKSDDKINVLSYVDVLIEGRYIESKRDLRLYLRGSSNQRIFRKNERGEFIECEK